MSALAPGASVRSTDGVPPDITRQQDGAPDLHRRVAIWRDPTVLAVSLVGVAGVPAPPPNCYDVDGDGVMNPLTDGLFMLRLQLGIAPVTAASGIVLNAPRNTPLKAALFMAQRCGFHDARLSGRRPRGSLCRQSCARCRGTARSMSACSCCSTNLWCAVAVHR